MITLCYLIYKIKVISQGTGFVFTVCPLLAIAGCCLPFTVYGKRSTVNGKRNVILVDEAICIDYEDYVRTRP